jgi:hypothetical protein
MNNFTNQGAQSNQKSNQSAQSRSKILKAYMIHLEIARPFMYFLLYRKIHYAMLKRNRGAFVDCRMLCEIENICFFMTREMSKSIEEEDETSIVNRGRRRKGGRRHFVDAIHFTSPSLF